MKLPMREKYVDEAVGVWITFGRHADGTVDISDQNRDVFAGIPPAVALKVVAAQAEFRETLYALLCKENR